MKMESRESTRMFKAIEDFLREERERAQAESAHALWEERSFISVREITMLMALMDGPLRLDALARQLGQDVRSTQRLLDAMVGVGVLELRGEEYEAGPAAIAYLQAIMRGTLPPSDED